MGAAPTSSGWKPDVLAGKLYLHIEGKRNRTFHHVPKASFVHDFMYTFRHANSYDRRWLEPS